MNRNHTITALLLLLLSGWSMTGVAQTENTQQSILVQEQGLPLDATSTIELVPRGLHMTQDTTMVTMPRWARLHGEDTLFSIDAPYRFHLTSPWIGYPFGPWSMDVHRGFNASLDAGVMVGFGRNNPMRGGAFFTNLTALYALPLRNDRWTLAVGGNYGHYTGWGERQHQFSLFGMANYRINDRLDLTGFISHDFGALGGEDRGLPRVPGFADRRTTVGADLGVKVNEHAKVNIGVSFTREEHPMLGGPMGPQPMPTPQRGNR